MKISTNELEHIANLARLKLSDDEKERLSGEMTNIIAFANKLNELDTQTVEPSAHSISVYNVLRDDEVAPSYPREKILQNAPEHDDVFFVVPKVVE